MLNITLNKADYAILISIIGITVTFINVNRQRKASMKNDEEKFKRELNLETYNEFVEILYELLIVLRKFKVIKERYQSVIISNPGDLIINLNEITWEITDSWFTSIQKVGAYYTKREFVLRTFDETINNISLTTKQLDDNLWRFKTYIWDHDSELENIQMTLNTMEELGNKSIIELTNLIKSLQKEFLGHLYK